jgi:hypothetical protein
MATCRVANTRTNCIIQSFFSFCRFVNRAIFDAIEIFWVADQLSQWEGSSHGRLLKPHRVWSEGQGGANVSGAGATPAVAVVRTKTSTVHVEQVDGIYKRPSFS